MRADLGGHRSAHQMRHMQERDHKHLQRHVRIYPLGLVPEIVPTSRLLINHQKQARSLYSNLFSDGRARSGSNHLRDHQRHRPVRQSARRQGDPNRKFDHSASLHVRERHQD